ncbi:MAG: hypothetical protein ACI9EZ_000341 [Halobacteriales archaeon]|jgi:hypothetical protein
MVPYPQLWGTTDGDYPNIPRDFIYYASKSGAESPMRYLRARLDRPDWMRHPMQEFLAASDRMEREELLAWNRTRDDVQFALFFAVGDVDAYRDRIEEVEAVRRCELTPVDETSFYAYICQEYTESDVAFFRAFAELNLVVVPPLVYDEEERGRVTVMGPGEALGDLVQGLRDRSGVGVDVLELGRYDRLDFLPALKCGDSSGGDVGYVAPTVANFPSPVLWFVRFSLGLSLSGECSISDQSWSSHLRRTGRAIDPTSDSPACCSRNVRDAHRSAWAS